MLRKLLKYDLLSVWKGGWGTLPIMAGITAVAAAAARVLNTDSSNYASMGSAYTISIILLSICAFAAVGCGIVIGNLVFVRFYNNFFTDEGYLTFTLPVKRNTLLLSKSLSAIICLVAYAVVAVVCVFAFLMFGGFEFDIFDRMRLVWNGYYRELGAMTFIYCAEFVLVFLCRLFFAISMLQFAITVGNAVASKARVIISIAVFFVTSVISSFIIPDFALFDSFGKTSSEWQNAAALLIFAIASFTVGLVLYFLTLDRISRKLNLD